MLGIYRITNNTCHCSVNLRELITAIITKYSLSSEYFPLHLSVLSYTKIHEHLTQTSPLKIAKESIMNISCCKK